MIENEQQTKCQHELETFGEVDPNGVAQHSPGSKLDAGKPRAAMVLGGFARALWKVAEVGTYGAKKYTDNGWMEVANGIDRYDDAGMRHWLKEKTGEHCDDETEIEHAAHDAWNALARLELILRGQSSAKKHSVADAEKAIWINPSDCRPKCFGHYVEPEKRDTYSPPCGHCGAATDCQRSKAG